VSSPDAASSPLRFVARNGRVVGRRGAVLLRGMAGRLRLRDGYLAWPNAAEPRQIVPAHRPEVAAWIRRTFEPWAARKLDAATWSVLRSRSLVVAGDRGSALLAAEQALGRPLESAVLGCVSDSGHTQAKLLCFVFESGRTEPSAVAKGIPARGQGARLLDEVSVIRSVRERLAGAPEAAALPPEPLWTGEVAGDEIVVERPDPLAASTGHEDREAALRWLRGFHAGTAGDADWGAEAELAERDDMIAFAWAQADPDRAAAALALQRERWEELRAAPLPRCAVHGDFWRGNVAVAGGELRVYDWEWASTSGHPLFDLWTYELAPLRGSGEPADGLAARLETARRRVEAELGVRGLDTRLARVLLMPVAAELGYRVRRVRGTPPDHEDRARTLLLAADRLLTGR
jgi:hypothetical protein